MATYKGIRGVTIRTVDGDPSPLLAGEVWYNSSSRTINGAKLPAGTWATGGDMTRGATSGRGNIRGAGPSTAAIAAGGYYPLGYAFTETYDGSSWTEVGDLGTTRWNIAMAGTQTATLAAAGQRAGPQAPPNMTSDVEEYNGTSWTEVTNLDTDRGSGAGCGTQTAALHIGGSFGKNHPSLPDWTLSELVEQYDGTNWTEIADINTARNNQAAFQKGTTTAPMIAAGYSTALVAITETFDGSSWTEVGDCNTARSPGCGFGTATDGVIVGGETPSVTANVEQWDGTSWTETTNYPTPTQGCEGAGTSSTGIVYGGATATARVAETYEWERAITASRFTSI